MPPSRCRYCDMKPGTRPPATAAQISSRRSTSPRRSDIMRPKKNPPREIATMKRLLLLVTAGLLMGSLAQVAPPAQASPRVSKAIAAAVADPARPADDRARDALRKPAACLAFARVHPGMSIAELLPGEGYFTRIFSRAVGPKGHVYEVSPPPKQPGTP